MHLRLRTLRPILSTIARNAAQSVAGTTSHRSGGARQSMPGSGPNDLPGNGASSGHVLGAVTECPLESRTASLLERLRLMTTNPLRHPSLPHVTVQRFIQVIRLVGRRGAVNV